MAIADEMQGIMSLPEETAAPTPEQTAAVDQMRSQLSPSEINTEMLGAAEEADPATVAEFKTELQGLQLPPEVLDMLNTMVEEILDAPQDYPALREKYMAQGLEDLLPPEFDPAFFGALNMAIDQIRGASPTAQGPMPSGVNTVEDIFTYKPAAAPASMPPEGFAQGGIASLGRNGDTMLAHITPDEAAMLRRRGGSGSINPATGLPEFFSLKGAFKKLGSAVKKFASSTVGKIVIGAALFTLSAGLATPLLSGFGSAAVAAGQGFIAGAGTNLLAGGNLKDSLKAGAKGALAAGAFKGIKEGASAFKAIKPAGTTATSFPASDTAEGITRKTFESTTPQGGGSLANASTASPNPLLETPLTTQVRRGLQTSNDLTNLKATNPNFAALSPETIAQEARAAAAAAPIRTGVSLQNGYTPPSAFNSSYTTLPSQGGIPLTGPNFGVATPSSAAIMPSAATTSGAAGSSTPPTGFFGNVKAAINPNDDVGIMKGLNRAFNPNEIKAAGMSQANDLAITAGIKAGAPGSAAYTTAYNAAYKAALPGMIQQYAPLIAGGLGIMAATGGFDAEQPEVPAGFEDMVKGISPGQKLLTQNPELYGLQFGGVNTTYAYNPAQYAMPYAPYAPPVGKRQGGGVASLMGYKEGSPDSYPRKTGHIAGPGTGTSDDVPAMLSDGEFVFTAKAVRAMGNGSRRAGAKRMYAMMKNLEGRKNG